MTHLNPQPRQEEGREVLGPASMLSLPGLMAELASWSRAFLLNRLFILVICDRLEGQRCGYLILAH